MTDEQTKVVDPFSEASSSFITLDDCNVDANGNTPAVGVTAGRLLLIEPLSIETRPSNLPGQTDKTYESITANVVILDGPVTEKIDAIPLKVDGMFVSGTVIVNQLKPKLPEKKPAQKYMLGRLGKQPSQTKGFGGAWVLNGNGYTVTESDKQLARNYLNSLDPFA